MLRKLSLVVAAAALAAGASALAPQAQAAEGGVKAGVLTCQVDSGWGFVFGSSKKLKCVYAHDHDSGEHYTGTINKFGVDVGYSAGSVIAWAVIAPTADVGKGALAGKYGGATGSAAVGVGAGAHVLIGGFKQSITLQPLSIEGSTGLNVAGGIAGVTLTHRP
jgi:uncharacterized protein DUF992